MIYGDYFIRCRDKNRFFRFWPILLLVSLSYFVITIFIPNIFLNDDINFFYMATYNVIFCLMYIHGNLGFCYFLSKFFNDKIVKAVTLISKNVNGIYVVQWFLIPNALAVIIFLNENFAFNDLSLIIFSIFILILSIALSAFYKKRIAPRIS